MQGRTLKCNLVKLLSLLTAMLAGTLICTFIFGLFHPSSWAYFGFLALGLAALGVLVGLRPRRQIDGAAATQIVTIYLLAYLLLIYLLGLATGFLKNGYSLAPTMILQNTLPVLAIVVATELLRYGMCQRVGDHKWLLVVIAAGFAALNIAVGLTTYHLTAPLDWLEMIGRLVLGSIATSALLTLVAYKSDSRPTLTYAVVMALYPIVVPIIPDLGAFIWSVLAIVLPTVLLLRFNEFFVTKRPIPGRERRAGRLLAMVPALAVLSVVVILVSGIFRYWATAIGSGSMTPQINMGDVVIIDQDYGAAEQLEPGTVVAFQHDGRIIVHRLVAVEQSPSGLRLHTKGDHNASEDAWAVTAGDIVGKVNWRIPWVGWPTVWIDQTF
jgi:signal peptidase